MTDPWGMAKSNNFDAIFPHATKFHSLANPISAQSPRIR